MTFFHELCLIIEKTTDDDFKNLLAQSILYAQDIRETSWNKEKSTYTKNHHQSALIACKHYQIDTLDEFWIYMVTRVNKHAWNDIQDWAKSILK